MVNIHIDLKNCYGIGAMQSDIKFGKGKNACIIYAPNGTMKTSFTILCLTLLRANCHKTKSSKTEFHLLV